MTALINVQRIAKFHGIARFFGGIGEAIEEADFVA
jgi:hypothetical protein